MGSKFETLKRRLASEVDTALTDLETKLDKDFLADCELRGRCPAHDEQECVEEIVYGDKVLPGLIVGAMEYGPSTLVYKMVTEAAREWCGEQECCCFEERIREEALDDYDGSVDDEIDRRRDDEMTNRIEKEMGLV